MLVAILACEQIYHPDLEEVNDKLVVEAALNAELELNTVKLYRSHSFNSENKTYPLVSGAEINLVDDQNNNIPFYDAGEGVYYLNYKLDKARSYHLHIELNGEIYESGEQAVPETPQLDSTYADYETRITISGTSNSKEDVKEEEGVRVFTNIDNEGSLKHYRFYARKVILYVDHYDTIISGREQVNPIYSWKSLYPTGVFNIAGPPEYSTQKNITGHPLEFFKMNYYGIITDTVVFYGWVYIVDQYGLNEDTYNYYKNLNSQLDAEGRIFDPVYIQVNGNIKSLTNPEDVVLGNFEISSYAEDRYYVMYYKFFDNLTIRHIPKNYDIPLKGAIKDVKPDFWDSIYMNVE